ncbi:MAG: ABC transporter permease [Eubacteriales bacterium]
MNFKQSFILAIKSIKGSKLRSFLTMLGIIIGVASVIILVSLIDGMSKDMEASFAKMGTNLISVNVMGRGTNRSVSINQIETMMTENQDTLASYSPVINVNSAIVKYETKSVDTTTITGTNENYNEIKNINLSSGRYIEYIDVSRLNKICVVGSYIVTKFFPGANPIGQTIKINGNAFKIVGVAEVAEDSTASSNDDKIYIPYTMAMRISGKGTIGSYSFSAVNKDTIDQAMAAINKLMLSVFGNENAYRVFNQASMIASVNSLTSTLSLVLVGIAAISLVVGGIGIMNIMLVSVIERTKEIGIRKSLGAKRKDIMRQFVIEAATTSSVGGIIGIIVGIGVAYLAGGLIGLTVAPSFMAVFIAFSVSVLIGIIFGYWPASKAANMNPIDALKYD